MTTVILKKILISPAHDFKGHHGKPRGNHPIVTCESVECVAGKGLSGDRYFGYKEDFKGQISFFDWALFEQMKIDFNQPDLDPSVMRRNVLVDGLQLNSLIGKKFSLGGVVFSGSEECAPCYWMDEAVGPGAEEYMKGRGGLRARIVTSGVLSVGSVDYALQ